MSPHYISKLDIVKGRFSDTKPLMQQDRRHRQHMLLPVPSHLITAVCQLQHHRGSCAKYCGVTYCARMVSPANMRP